MSGLRRSRKQAPDALPAGMWLTELGHLRPKGVHASLVIIRQTPMIVQHTRQPTITRDATTVAARVGRASTRMTLDRYAHALPAGDVDAAAIIGAMLPA